MSHLFRLNLDLHRFDDGLWWHYSHRLSNLLTLFTKTFYEHNSRLIFLNILKAHKTNNTPKTTLNYYDMTNILPMTFWLGACYVILAGTPVFNFTCLLESKRPATHVKEKTHGIKKSHTTMICQGSTPLLHPGRPSAFLCTIVWLLEHLFCIVPTSYI